MTTESHSSGKETELRNVFENLIIFSKYFVAEIETKLLLYYEIIEGNVNKTGKLVDTLGDVTSTGVMLIPSIFGYKTGDGAKNIIKMPFQKYGAKQQKKRAIQLSDILYDFHENKIEKRTFLVEMAVDIFQSFEMQFLRLDTKMGKRKAMKKLAKDAAYRILDRARSDEKKELVVENLLVGKSKTKSIVGIPLPAKVKQSGSTLTYFYNNEERSWNTSCMYEEVGVVMKDDEKNIYYKNRNVDNSNYGYRRIFFAEDTTKLNDTYEIDKNPEPSFIIDYIGTLDYYKKQIDNIVLKISEDDSNLDYKRHKTIIEEAKTDILQELGKVHETLDQIDMNTCMEKIYKYFKDTRAECKEFLGVIQKAHEETKIQLQRIEAENRNEHEKTRAVLLQNYPKVQEKRCFRFAFRKPDKSFISRDKQLEELHNILQNNKCDGAISNAVCIVGIRGVGKTQLARKYAQKYLDCYDSVIFIDAQHTLDSFKSLAVVLDIHYNDSDNFRLVQDIFKHFDKDCEKTLFVYDDAENFKSIRDFLPLDDYVMNKPYILITSYYRRWDIGGIGDIQMFPLDEFTLEEAIDYIKLILKLDSVEDNNIKILIDKLQRLPLALGQAGRYISRENEKMLKRYGKKFAILEFVKQYETRKALLDVSYNENEDDIKTVFGTLSLTLSKVAEHGSLGETALKILNIMAYISTDNIYIEDIFKSMIEENDVFWDSVELLHDYSIINLENRTASVHTLVQEVVKLQMINNGTEEDVLKDGLNLFKHAEDNLCRHLVVIWEHASKYEKLVKYFYPRWVSKSYGNTPLHLLAAHKDDHKAISNILKYTNFRNIDVENISHHTPLYVAATNGHFNIVKYLYSKKARIDYTIRSTITSEDNAILKTALHNNHNEIVKFVIRKTKTFEKDDVLEISYFSLNYEIVKFLEPKYKNLPLMNLVVNIKKNYDHERFVRDLNAVVSMGPNFINNKIGKITVLEWAVDFSNVEAVRLLIENGADTGVKTANFCSTPLHLAVNKECMGIIQHLVKAGARLDTVDYFGNTPLHEAILKGCNLEIIKFLIENDAEWNKPDILNRSLLHKAILKCTEDIVDFFLHKGIDINSKDRDDSTPLHNAAKKGNSRILKLLLEKGADPNIIDTFKRLPLHYAVKEMDLESVKLLIDGGKNLDIIDRDGMSCLHHASSSGNLDVVQFVFEYHNDVNITDNYNRTPLNYAVSSGKIDVVKFLIENGADCDHIQNDGKSMLYDAIRNKSYDILKILLDEGINMNYRQADGSTILHTAVQMNFERGVEILLEYEFDPNVTNNQGSTCLHIASSLGRLDIIKILLNYNADIHVLDNMRNSVLHVAASRQKYFIIELFLKEGIDPNIKNSQGKTALYYSSSEYKSFRKNIYDINIIELLLKYKADLNVCDNNGETLLHSASLHGAYEVVRLLLIDHNFDLNAVDYSKSSVLHNAVKSGNAEVVQFLIEQGIDPNVTDINNKSPLHFCNDITILTILLENRAKPDLKDDEGCIPLHCLVRGRNKLEKVELLAKIDHALTSRDIYGCTPLHYAGKYCKEAIELLLGLGADPNSSDNYEKTTLHYVTGSELNSWEKTNLDYITYLLDKGANINATDKDGRTALHFAIEYGDFIAIDFLLKNGANVNAVTKIDNYTPLSLALKKCGLKEVKLLIEHGADIEMILKEWSSTLNSLLKSNNDELYDYIKNLIDNIQE